PAKDRKAQGFMIGPAFVCYACKRRPGTTGCWSDDQSPIRPIWHSMSHSDPVRANCATSPLSLGCAGRSRNVSNRPRGRPDLIIVKRAVGTVGIVTWRFRCSPSRSSPACARACLKQKLLPPPAKRTKGVYPQLPDRNRGFDRHHGARIAAAHYPCAEAPAHRPELPLGLVTLETSPPSQRQTRPLSKTRREVGIQITATVVLEALGVPAPDLLSWVTIFIELFGGLAVFLGAFIPLVSIPMAIILLVAIFTVHVPNGFSSIKLLSVDAAGAHFGQPGYETPLLYLAALISLVIGGSGPLALDRFLLRPRGRQ